MYTHTHIYIYIYYVYAQLLGEVLYKALFYLICIISDRNFKFTAKKVTWEVMISKFDVTGTSLRLSPL